MATRIVIAEQAGACYGVERALELTLDTAAAGPRPVYTLGPLIHNPRVVNELEQAGVQVAQEPEDAAGGTLILRTHGVSPEVETRAREVCTCVVDATCPFVKRCHRVVERFARDGYQVLIIGESGHPEVEGTRGHVPEALVIDDVSELEGADLAERVGVVVQTTQARSNFDGIVKVLEERVKDLVVENTICEATSGHQGATMELAQEADVVIVIGGKNSANTTHLAEIAKAYCERTYHIESENELKATWFEGAECIGIAAGASTPASQIEAVRERICSLVGECD